MVFFVVLLFLNQAYAQFDKVLASPLLRACGKPGLLDDMGALVDPELPECRLPTKPISHEIPAKNSPTGVRHMYAIVPVGVREYELQFNLDFYDGEHWDEAAFEGKWRNTVANCFAQVKGRLRGPNKEYLNLVLAPRDSKIFVPQVKIKIAENIRSDSDTWDSRINCSAIIHEVFHLAGLVDEYKEQKKMTAPRRPPLAYDCRRLYDDNSIMADADLRWDLVMSDYNLGIAACVCQRSDGCKEFFENADIFGRIPPKCPDGFSESGKVAMRPVKGNLKPQWPLTYIPDDLFVPEKQAGLAILKSAGEFPPPNNLIEPRHFNAIMFPGCLAKNMEYYEDAANAYRTRVESGGYGCRDLGWLKQKNDFSRVTENQSDN